MTAQDSTNWKKFLHPGKLCRPLVEGRGGDRNSASRPSHGVGRGCLEMLRIPMQTGLRPNREARWHGVAG